ncbi:protein angel homolog 1 [Lampris incognitus]|uniref:protein angel homolog 1 n=1 Tax=Lampris incognitus TaxID=2546036 RepID=UPI0024B51E4A|nr:protein angel homolog 1 [Lampris incognitus]
MLRVWEQVNKSPNTTEPAESSLPHNEAFCDFTVMSYNILAQDLLEAHQELYSYCSQEVLEWSYRCHLLIEEILKWRPDILCLQEVQENHYEEHLHPVLYHMGYTCVYKRRTGTKTDGCATCYRGNHFSELSVSLLEFHRPETGLLDRDNVGIVLLLQPLVNSGSEAKAKGPPLCVANTHLLFNPKRVDIKLAQLAIVLADINKVVKSCKDKGDHCNVILCGDFNSNPYVPLYQLITTGQLFYQGLPAWMTSGQWNPSHKSHHHRLFASLSSLGISDNCQYITREQKFESKSQNTGKLKYNHDFLLQLQFCPAACVRPLDLELIPGVTDNTPDASRENQPYTRGFTISHGLNLRSAYKHILSSSGHSEVTTLHSEGAATTDYIFYTPNDGGCLPSEGLKLTHCLSLLSEEELWSMKGLPNEIFPSDHLSLLAEFQLDLRPHDVKNYGEGDLRATVIAGQGQCHLNRNVHPLSRAVASPWFMKR